MRVRGSMTVGKASYEELGILSSEVALPFPLSGPLASHLPMCEVMLWE